MFAISWLPIQLILLLKSIGLYPVTILNISIQVRAYREKSKNILKMFFILSSRNQFTSQQIMFCFLLSVKIVHHQDLYFQIGSHVLAYSNSCVNPILYAFLSPQFRTGFRNVLSCLSFSRRGYQPGQQTPPPAKAVMETVHLNNVNTNQTQL